MATISQKNVVIKNLHAKLGEQAILRGVDLAIKPGSVVALLGPNGSGKSTLSHVLMGHPDYAVTRGQVLWQGKDILKLTLWERARMGLFLAFQYPQEVPGVNFHEFLVTAYQARFNKTKTQADFDQALQQALRQLKLPEKFLQRSLNDGFSGGEKKKAEMLQLLLLQPSLAILDETDSGLDSDALKIIAATINKLRSPKISFLIITHYQRLLHHVKPDVVAVMIEGAIVKTGGAELVPQIERQGYGQWLKK